MKTRLFQKGKRYYATTRSGEVRLFDVTNVLRRKSTKERVFVVGKFDGNCEQRYEIRHTNNGEEYIIVDNRYATVVDTTEYKRKSY